MRVRLLAGLGLWLCLQLAEGSSLWQQLTHLTLEDRNESNDASFGRQLQSSGTPKHCHPLSKEVLQAVAVDNHVLVSVMDRLVWDVYGPSWVQNVKSAGIKYWLIAALDPHTSIMVAEAGEVHHCFNAPMDRLKYKPTNHNEGYRWGSHHWAMTTWNKVHVMRAVYQLGFHIIHSDADVTWFRDPLPYFKNFLGTEKHTLFATDMTTSYNDHGELGHDVEKETHPYININTGVYWIQQWPHGQDLFDEWIKWQPKNIGHDQDGFNFVARGRVFRGDNDMPDPHHDPAAKPRMFFMAHNRTAGISFLPGSMFGNAYTYVNTRLHEVLHHPLYEVHWVWGGSTLEAKRQNMRDAMKFCDPPEYYTAPDLVTFDLQHVPMPDGFNSWPDERTEEMIRFHVEAANLQLQQAYYAFAATVVLNRTLVIPRYRCYCSKNWYMTQACRINGEKKTAFPFTCALSQLMRVKRLSEGVRLTDRVAGGVKVAHVREYSFLENPKVPEETKKSRLVVYPLPGYTRPAASEATTTSTQVAPGDVAELSKAVVVQDHGNGTVSLGLPWPLDDQELMALLRDHMSKRVIHFTDIPTTLGRDFRHPQMAAEYDTVIQSKVTAWCCRSPADMKRLNAPDKIQLQILPPSRPKPKRRSLLQWFW